MKVKLGDVASFSKGAQINGDELMPDGEYSFLNGGIYPSGKWSAYNVCGRTITISEGGNSSGYVNYMEQPFWCGAHCYYLFDLKCDSKYLFYALKSQQERIMQLRSGACMPNIRKSDLARFELDIDPDISNQKTVVQILDRITRLIALREKQLAKLDEVVKARFVEMFGDLNINPMGWEFQKLSSLCDVRDGTHDSPEYQNEGYPLLTSKNFSSGIIDFSDCNLICEEDFEMINRRSKVDYGDIIMPMIGTIGHPVIVDIDRPFAIKNVALIKFNNKEISNNFVKTVLDSDYFLNVTTANSRGGTQKFIALGDIRNIPIPIVPKELQIEFADFAKEVERQKLTIQQSLDKLEVLRRSLMQEHFG